MAECKAMIDRNHSLPIARQARALGISRGSAYYLPRPISKADLALMCRLDELHLERPFAGARMLRDLLTREDIRVGRKRVTTLMCKLRIQALYRKPHARRHLAHRIYPYLLRSLSIDRSSQVWAMDITYIPMVRGFNYLVAVMDWVSRTALAWRVSITMDAEFCVAAMEEAIIRCGEPEIVNFDQGSQVTSVEFTELLKDNDIRISMDGRSCWRDNIFLERLWKTVKYEEVYLQAYEPVSHARPSISRYLDFYNARHPHSRLDRVTPDQFYFNALPMPQVA
jgi:putative transposase